MSDDTMFLGLDAGSVAVSAALISGRGDLVWTGYDFHRGDVAGSFGRLLAGVNFSNVGGVAATDSTPSTLLADRRYDDRVAMIAAARRYHPEARSLLVVGGEKFGLARFDEAGNYRGFHSNTSCAAGTGAFLDQQARRLNLGGIEELSRAAQANKGGQTPKIASRCAVFAKTDLVHAQQEGFTLEEICDGLCLGLTKNIADTLFKGEPPLTPILFAGGVARNRAVVRRLRDLTGMSFLIDESGALGAAGAALMLAEEAGKKRWTRSSPADLFGDEPGRRRYFHPPLELTLSNYPEFDSLDRYDFVFQDGGQPFTVEVDVYEPLEGERLIYLGIDVGSTSTKAILTDPDGQAPAGFYTRTAGRPVDAVRALLASIADLAQRYDVKFEIAGMGATGSGRKFVGKVFGADLVLDEITAHARAALRLAPDADTIIEIGGQDSKFTTLKDGRVTFSVMNNVCAAGTGSFIEEQAQRLDCPLSDYSKRAEGQPSPIASDRCTVFMERDLNHYLREGYSKDEALAAVLHSVRENYLSKVAVENAIGQVVLFQGATAKNRALVAAFEQRLGRPIHVSRFCHLTGAWGAALSLIDRGVSGTTFKGLDLYKKRIPIRSETCELCTNHCKIVLAEVEGEETAFGFLCGRDYETRKYVDRNRSGFDLLRERKKAFRFERPAEYPTKTVIGLPAALHLFEDLPFWEKFFDELGIRTIASRDYKEAVADGKRRAGTDFCAPMAALHGHVHHLLERCDYVFLPVGLERKPREKGLRRQYCYYTQYASSLAVLSAGDDGDRILMPLTDYIYSGFFVKRELYKALSRLPGGGIAFLKISDAYNRAETFMEESRNRLRDVYRDNLPQDDQPHVVLLGRPYTLLAPHMNKRIPEMFGQLGYRAFYQDMIGTDEKDLTAIQPLLKEVRWKYGAEILAAAEITARTPGAYPVLVTSFKCAPDSFIIEYFKSLMEARRKPYLVLQLDDHDSSVGYETRIEAAVRAFENHFQMETKAPAHSPGRIPMPERVYDLTGKTLYLPNWDSLVCRFLAASLNRFGVDARLLREDDSVIRRSLRLNTGQCLPLNIIAREYADNILEDGIDPSRAAIWICHSEQACNLSLFPHHIRTLLSRFGQGLERAGVYTGPWSFIDVSLRMPVEVYLSIMFGGLIRKMACAIRPYEKQPGRTDMAVAAAGDLLDKVFRSGAPKGPAVEQVVSMFEAIEHERTPRPKAAVFGDLYVRDNEIINQDLVHFIEANGGEVAPTPYHYYIRMIAGSYLRKWLREGLYKEAVTSEAILLTLRNLEKKYYRIFQRVLHEPIPRFDEPVARILAEYNVRVEHTGESMDNLLKVFYLLRDNPDLALFIQTSPAFCCPSLVTEAMSRDIEAKTGVPVVCLTYDGAGGGVNAAVAPYLKFHTSRSTEKSYLSDGTDG